MSSTSALENTEDLETVALVRMEDVQPSRKEVEVFIGNEQLLDTYVVDNDIVFDNECVVDDEDSNVGSMVSIHSEDVDDSSNCELIVPDLLDQQDSNVIIKVEQEDDEQDSNLTNKSNIPCSWPTLEILPGGVIKNADNIPIDKSPEHVEKDSRKEMVYACAKCPQEFQYLFNLVKHVKWHEKQNKQAQVTKIISDALKPKPLKHKKKFIIPPKHERKVILKQKFIVPLNKNKPFVKKKTLKKNNNSKNKIIKQEIDQTHW